MKLEVALALEKVFLVLALINVRGFFGVTCQASHHHRHHRHHAAGSYGSMFPAEKAPLRVFRGIDRSRLSPEGHARIDLPVSVGVYEDPVLISTSIWNGRPR